MDTTGTGGGQRHAIPPPPPTAEAGLATADPSVGNPFVANPVVNEEVPLLAGQLAPGWKTLFIGGWVGVLAGFGCIWQASRVAGIATWWLGPETNPRLFLVTALPFIAPLLAIAAAVIRLRSATMVGLLAGLVSSAMSIGDYAEHPGLATGEAAIGLAGVLISAACFAGRMRDPHR